MCAICALVANVGLSTLISLSIPVLVAIYPVAIALVAMTFLKDFYAHPRLAFRLVLLVSMLFGALDGLKTAGLNLELFQFLPLFNQGLAWIIPTLTVMVLSGLPRQPAQTLAEEQA